MDGATLTITGYDDRSTSLIGYVTAEPLMTADISIDVALVGGSVSIVDESMNFASSVDVVMTSYITIEDTQTTLAILAMEDGGGLLNENGGFIVL